MKTKICKPTFLILLMTLSWSMIAISQDDMPPERMKEKKEKLQAQKIAFLTDRLDLTTAEAQQFWPVYNEFEGKRETELTSFREKFDYRPEELEELSEDKAAEFSDELIKHEQRLLDLRKEYHTKLKTVLSAKKILLLYESEKQFKRELLERIKDHQGPPPPHRR
jgi:hypothetical protein